jgi:hypothetical protein
VAGSRNAAERVTLTWAVLAAAACGGNAPTSPDVGGARQRRYRRRRRWWHERRRHGRHRRERRVRLSAPLRQLQVLACEQSCPPRHLRDRRELPRAALLRRHGEGAQRRLNTLHRRRGAALSRRYVAARRECAVVRMRVELRPIIGLFDNPAHVKLTRAPHGSALATELHETPRNTSGRRAAANPSESGGAFWA